MAEEPISQQIIDLATSKKRKSEFDKSIVERVKYLDKLINDKNHQQCSQCLRSFLAPDQTDIVDVSKRMKFTRNEQNKSLFSDEIWKIHGCFNLHYSCALQYFSHTPNINKCLCNSSNHTILPDGLRQLIRTKRDIHFWIEYLYGTQTYGNKPTTEDVPYLYTCPFDKKSLPYFCKAILNISYRDFLKFMIEQRYNVPHIACFFLSLDKEYMMSAEPYQLLVNNGLYSVLSNYAHSYREYTHKNIINIILETKKFDMDNHYHAFKMIFAKHFRLALMESIFTNLASYHHYAIRLCLNHPDFNPTHDQLDCCSKHNLCRNTLHSSLNSSNYPVFKNILKYMRSKIDFVDLLYKRRGNNLYDREIYSSERFIQEIIIDEKNLYSIYWAASKNMRSHLQKNIRFNIDKAKEYLPQHKQNILTYKQIHKYIDDIKNDREFLFKAFINDPTSVPATYVVDICIKQKCTDLLYDNMERGYVTREQYNQIYKDICINYPTYHKYTFIKDEIDPRIAEEVIMHFIKHNIPIPEHVVVPKFDHTAILNYIIDHNVFNVILYLDKKEITIPSEIIVRSCKLSLNLNIYIFLFKNASIDVIEQVKRIADEHNNVNAQFAIEYKFQKP